MSTATTTTTDTIASTTDKEDALPETMSANDNNIPRYKSRRGSMSDVAQADDKSGARIELCFKPATEKKEKESDNKSDKQKSDKDEDKEEIVTDHLPIGLVFDDNKITGFITDSPTQVKEMLDDKEHKLEQDMLGWFIFKVNDVYQHADTEKIKESIEKNYLDHRDTKIIIQEKEPRRLLPLETKVWAQWRSKREDDPDEKVRVYAGKVQRITPGGNYFIQFIDHEVRNDTPRDELAFRYERENAAFQNRKHSNANMAKIMKMRSMTREEIRDWFKNRGGEIRWKTWDKAKWEKYKKLCAKKKDNRNSGGTSRPMTDEIDLDTEMKKLNLENTNFLTMFEEMKRKSDKPEEENEYPDWFLTIGKKVEEIEKNKWEIYSKDFYIKRRRGEDIYHWEDDKWKSAFGNSEISLPHDFFHYWKDLKQNGFQPVNYKESLIDKFFSILFGETILCGKSTHNVDELERIYK